MAFVQCCVWGHQWGEVSLTREVISQTKRWFSLAALLLPVRVKQHHSRGPFS